MMNYLVCLATFILFNAGIDAAPASASLKTSELQYERCPRGLGFDAGDGCNWCFCVPETGAVGCTIELCEESFPPSEPEAKFLKTSKVRDHAALKSMNTSEVAWSTVSIGGRCPEFVPSIDSCNTCFCNPATGIIGCTMMACPEMNYVETKSNHETAPASKSLKTSEGTESLCQDFLLHNTDDNCECNPETGLVQCTMYLEHGPVEIDHGPIRISKSLKTSDDAEISCEDFFQYNNNDICFCNPETGLVQCTLFLQYLDFAIGGDPIRISKSMKTTEPQYENCPNGLHFPSEDGCNSCFCVPENGAVGCTLMACPQPLLPPESKKSMKDLKRAE